MNIESVLDKTLTFAKQSYEVGKNTALLVGRQVQMGYTKYLLPAAERVYSAALTTLRSLGQLLEKGPGPLFALATGLFLAGIAAFKFADQKTFEDDAVAKAIWKTIGVASFIGATAATSCGLVILCSA